MSLMHLVYAGDFELVDGTHLRMTNTPSDPIYRPVVRRRLDPGVVDRLVSEVSASGRPGVLPTSWSLRLEDGYLIGDRYALGSDELEFLKKVVAEASCRLFERGFEISLDDLSPLELAASKPRIIATVPELEP